MFKLSMSQNLHIWILAVKVKAVEKLGAVMQFLWQPFCSIQDGGHTQLGANGNIDFQIAYSISFQKMYSLQSLQGNPTKLHNNPD